MKIVSKKVTSKTRKVRYKITREMCEDVWRLPSMDDILKQEYIREERERKIGELLDEKTR